MAIILAGGVLLGSGAGCRDSVRRLDAREERDPLMRRAAAKQAEGDTDYAMDLYRKVLELDPRSARASLDLALLLHDAKADYIPALYHYGRYLDLRPNTEKRDLIENRMRLARQAFAAANLPPSGDRATMREAERLRINNAEMRDRIRQLETELAALKEKAAERPRPPPPPRRHRVRPGETLTQIAQRHNVGVADLVRRNKLKDANAIYAGQTLEIPPE
jgi:tetratricopeptide (TPR) repeat protein